MRKAVITIRVSATQVFRFPFFSRCPRKESGVQIYVLQRALFTRRCTCNSRSLRPNALSSIQRLLGPCIRHGSGNKGEPRVYCTAFTFFVSFAGYGTKYPGHPKTPQTDNLLSSAFRKSTKKRTPSAPLKDL